eukprot:TRINITY_DN3339_c0_g1_i1.p1 TRINITY_DN3339_c0_g1~~TRINITY_DN3339_c0_g1_i1.p1  ORF type:complete len:215 (+),score=6.84 TRINITY_DN3339_c0_g1_i1:3-647(+)
MEFANFQKSIYAEDEATPAWLLTTLKWAMIVLAAILIIIQIFVVPVDIAIIAVSFGHPYILTMIFSILAVISKYTIVVIMIMTFFQSFNNKIVFKKPLWYYIIIGTTVGTNLYYFIWTIVKIAQNDHTFVKVISNPVVYGTLILLIGAGVLFGYVLIHFTQPKKDKEEEPVSYELVRVIPEKEYAPAPQVQYYPQLVMMSHQFRSLLLHIGDNE